MTKLTPSPIASFSFPLAAPFPPRTIFIPICSALSAYAADQSSIEELLVALGRVIRGPKQFAFLNDVQRLVRREDMARFREERFLWQATDSPRKGLVSNVPAVCQSAAAVCATVGPMLLPIYHGTL